MSPDPTSYAERLERCYTGAVYDTLRALGRPDQILPTSLHPVDYTGPLAGPVYTVSGRADSTLDAHTTLLEWTALLSKAPRGTVVICQPNNRDFAFMGELSAETLKLRGIRGYIADGGCRDTEFIRKIGFRVWCEYTTPRDVVGRWKPESFARPIAIGGVEIRTGDYVLADRDGIVIIPGAMIDEVVLRTEAVLATENKVRSAILAGEDPQQAYLRYGKF